MIPFGATCRTCRWWEHDTAAEPELRGHGLCRRHAPRLEIGRTVPYPVTVDDHYCGDWTHKDPHAPGLKVRPERPKP